MAWRVPQPAWGGVQPKSDGDLPRGFLANAQVQDKYAKTNYNQYDAPTFGYAGAASAAPSGQVKWKHMPGLNCWWNGHGSEEIENPRGSATPGITTLAQCQASCLQVPGCQGVVVTTMPGATHCYRKTNLQPALCDRAAQLDLYMIDAPMQVAAAPGLAVAGAGSTWDHHPNTNCWWDGHGAVEIDTPNGQAVPGVKGLDACKASCTEHGFDCMGIIYAKHTGLCYRKGKISIAKCQVGNQYDLYLRTDPFPPSPPSPPPSEKFLTSAKCSSMMRDRNHKFWTMWSMAGWRTRNPGDMGCWGGDENQANSFFATAESGSECWANWNYNWGHGLKDAPAVFGFSESMTDYCNKEKGGRYNGDVASACQQANINILRVGNWNMCINTKWMFCATQGKLPGQGDGRILFSLAPKDLDVTDLEENKLPRCCGDYAEDDIYYLEVCTLNELCANNDQLFSLNVGDPFYCAFDPLRYQEMQRVLRQWD